MSKSKKASKETAAKADPKTPKEDLVVFAFRLTQEERALIHKAAGPAKASRFVRALSVAASTGDAKTVGEMLEAVESS